MTDEVQAAQEAAPEVVQTEAEQVAAPEAAESTEGQVTGQPAEPEGEEEAKSKSQQRRERRKEAQRRMLEEKQQAEAVAMEARRKLAEAQEAASKLARPKMEDFEDYEEYQAALTAYAATQALDSRELQRLQAEDEAKYQAAIQFEQQRKAELTNHWDFQKEEGRSKYSDFDEVALNERLPVSPVLGEIIADSDFGADVLYSLAKTPDVLSELNNLHPLDMARAIGRIEAQVNAPKPKTITDAPAPTAPVRGNSAPRKDPEKMSYEEFKKARMAGNL